MPKPRKAEKKDHFIARAIKEFKKEGYTQAIGRAEGFWKTYRGKK